MSSPSVSCLCVTENRAKYLQRAISCFLSQTYQNKELVIVYRDGDAETVSLVNSLNSPQINCYCIPSAQKVSLGYLRNYSIAVSGGEYFCQWDDDDWYHSDRVQQQVETVLLHKKDACVLKHVLFYDTVTGAAYFSFDRPWENTIFCSKEMFVRGIRYADLNQKEDTLFMRELLLNNNLSVASGLPSYVYIFHGHNTWNREHFEMLFSYSQKLSDSNAQLIGEVLKGKFSEMEASIKLKSDEFVRELDFLYRWQNHFKN